MDFSNLNKDFFVALWPISLLTLGSLVVLLLSTLKSGLKSSFHGTLCILVVSFCVEIFLSFFTSYSHYSFFEGIFIRDSLSTFATLSLLTISAITVLTLKGPDKKHLLHPEVYVLLLFSLIGMILLVSTRHLLMYFIALEMMSFPLYILVAIKRSSRLSSEAGVKYFIMGGVASCFFLYGMSLLFGHAKTLDLSLLKSVTEGARPLLYLGSSFLVVSFLFKIGAVPFHAWVPDVYQGAPSPITGFMAGATKFASFVAFLRLLQFIFPFVPFLCELLMGVAILTMLYGNIMALYQEEMKRLLAYSSIAHTGYLLVGVLAIVLGSVHGSTPFLFYLVSYVAATLGAFSVLSLFTNDLSYKDMCGFGIKHPLMGAMFALFIFSLAGIPMTAGLMAKYYLMLSAFPVLPLFLLMVAFVASMISLIYYFRIILCLFNGSEGYKGKNKEFFLFYGAIFSAALMCICTLLLGLYPQLFFTYFI